MKLKFLSLLPLFALSTEAATLLPGVSANNNPLVFEGLGVPDLLAVIRISGAQGNTGYSQGTSAPYSNLDNNLRVDGAGGLVIINFFSDFNFTTNTGTAATFSGQLNFFDIDTFQLGGQTLSDELTFSIDGGADQSIVPSQSSINDANTREQFLANGNVTVDLVNASSITFTNDGSGTFIFDVGSFAVPEPSSTALLGLGGLALLARRRR